MLSYQANFNYQYKPTMTNLSTLFTLKQRTTNVTNNGWNKPHGVLKENDKCYSKKLIIAAMTAFHV